MLRLISVERHPSIRAGIGISLALSEGNFPAVEMTNRAAAPHKIGTGSGSDRAAVNYHFPYAVRMS